MRPNISYLLITFLLCAVIGRAQSTQCVVKVVDAKSNAAINASVWDEINSNYYEVDKFGNCIITNIKT